MESMKSDNPHTQSANSPPSVGNADVYRGLALVTDSHIVRLALAIGLLVAPWPCADQMPTAAKSEPRSMANAIRRASPRIAHVVD